MDAMVVFSKKEVFIWESCEAALSFGQKCHEFFTLQRSEKMVCFVTNRLS